MHVRTRDDRPGHGAAVRRPHRGGRSRARARLAVAIGAAALAPHAAADIFIWDGTCGDGLWFGCCEGPRCSADDPPNACGNRNNWATVPECEPCEGIPDCPPYPSTDSDVFIGANDVTANFGSANTLSIDGILTLHATPSLRIRTSADFNGPFIWTKGDLTTNTAGPPAEAFAHAGITISGPDNKRLTQLIVLHNLAGATWTGASDLDISSGAVLDNPAGVAFDIQTDADIRTQNIGDGYIENAGIFRKSAGAGETEVRSAEFHNLSTGLVHVQTGTLGLHNSGGSSTGAFRVDPGAILELGNSFALEPGTTFSGVGLLRPTSASDIVNNTTVTVQRLALRSSAEEWHGPGTLNIGLSFDLSAGSVGRGGINSPTGALNILQGATVAIQGSSSKGIANYNTSNAGAINFGGTGSLTFTAQHGESFQNLAGGVIDFQGDRALTRSGDVSLLANAGTILKSAGTGIASIALRLANSGTVESRSGTLSFSREYDQSAGVTRLSGGNLRLTAFPLNMSGGTLEGSGQVTGDVENTGGAVRPGASAGTITVSGDYSQEPPALLEIDLGGTEPGTEFDVLNITGDAALGGDLLVTLIDGFEPSTGDQFDILAARTVLGGFDSVSLPTLAHGSFQVQYLSGIVRLFFCAADFDGNGTLNVFDFLAFQSAFGNEDPAADLDGNGILNVFDFLAFQTAFSNGC